MPDPLDFVAEAEPWTRYTLSDGTKLSVRVILTKVWRDGSDEEGNPKYQCQFQQILDVTPSEFASDRPGSVADGRAVRGLPR